MYEKRKYSHVMLVRRVRTRNTKDQKTGRPVSTQLTSSLRMIQSDFYFCQLCEEWSLRRWKPSSKKKGGGFDCSNSDKAGGLLEPRNPQGVQLHATSQMTEM